MVIAEKIDDYCERNEITVRDFEIMCNLPNGAVGKWRKGKCSPTLRTLRKIEEGTRIPLVKWIK